MKTWHNLPYLATNDVIFIVLESWSLERHTLVGSTIKMDNSLMQCKKEETKLRMMQLARNCRKEEVAAKAHEACDAVKLVKQQKAGGEEHEGQKSPSPRTEAERETEQGGMD